MTDSEIHCGILDFYDHWDAVNPLLRDFHHALSPHSEAFGHDLVDLATYAHEILHWLEPLRIRTAPSVVIASRMTQAFLVSLRTAADATGSALAVAAIAKPGQAPSDSLRALHAWAERNPPG